MGLRGPKPVDPLVRFFRFVVKTETCWLWKGSTTRGYGKFYAEPGRKRIQWAHRWIYERMVGSIPEGMELDHTCEVELCVNPAHLEPVPPKENKRRMLVSIAVRYAELKRRYEALVVVHANCGRVA